MNNNEIKFNATLAFIMLTVYFFIIYANPRVLHVSFVSENLVKNAENNFFRRTAFVYACTNKGGQTKNMVMVKDDSGAFE